MHIQIQKLLHSQLDIIFLPPTLILHIAAYIFYYSLASTSLCLTHNICPKILPGDKYVSCIHALDHPEREVLHYIYSYNNRP